MPRAEKNANQDINLGWFRGDYEIIDADYPEPYLVVRQAGELEEYNIFEYPNGYRDFANLDLDKPEQIRDFCRDRGLLGISGWAYQVSALRDITSRTHHYPNVSFELKENIEEKYDRPLEDFEYPDTALDEFLLTFYTDSTSPEHAGGCHPDFYHEFPCTRPPHPYKEPLEYVRAEQSRMKVLLNAWERIKQRGTATDDDFNSFLIWANFDSRSFIVEAILNPKKKKTLSHLLIYCLEMATNNIDARRGYKFIAGAQPSLLTGLYLQLSDDIDRRVSIKVCRNPRCDNYFRAQRKNKVYCCKSCKELAIQAKSYDRKKRTSTNSD